MKTMKQVKNEAKHLYRLCLVDGSLDENRVRQVIRLVLESQRRGYLALVWHFQQLVRLYVSQHSARVESAAPLPPELQDRVQDGLERVYGSGIRISFAQSPSLIGGMRIKAGSDVYDDSVKARLAAVENAFDISSS